MDTAYTSATIDQSSAKDILRRAVAIDADRLAAEAQRISLATLSAAAAEAGISECALSSALQEYNNEQQRYTLREVAARASLIGTHRAFTGLLGGAGTMAAFGAGLAIVYGELQYLLRGLFRQTPFPDPVPLLDLSLWFIGGLVATVIAECLRLTALHRRPEEPKPQRGR